MLNNRILLPSLFTVLNFSFGFISIVETLIGNLNLAAWLILLAILCDGMDGKLARWAGCETQFGLQLDSFADLLASGVAPALLVLRGGLNEHPIAGSFFALIFSFAGAYRLARFNIVYGGNRRLGYWGVPLPIAGIAVASFWIFDPPFGFQMTPACWITLLSSLSVLMVTSIHYQWPRLNFSGGGRQIAASTALSIGIFSMAVFPQWSLAPLFTGFILQGVIRWIILAFQRRVGWKELFFPSHVE